MRPGGELGQLVDAAKARDRFAFARLVERDAPGAYRAALAVLRSAEDAQDATQAGHSERHFWRQATLRAWQRLPDLREASSWPAWYRRIAVRTAIDMARRRRASGDLLARSPSAEDEPDPGPAADERMTILGALARLSADDRAVLGLRFGADLEVPDLAATLGIRLGTAKARLHRALRRLETELTKHGEDNEL